MEAGSGARPVVSPADEAQRRVHELESQLDAQTAELDDRNHQLKHLMLDLGLKDEFAIEQRSRLIEAEAQRVELEGVLAHARAELTKCQAELARLRLYESELQEIKNRSGYRLLETANRALSRSRSIARAVRWTARHLAGRP